MSADSHDILSIDGLTRRLSEVRRAEEHLKRELPPDSPHNLILRLADIIAYTGIPYPWIRRQFPEMYRMPSVRPRGKNLTDKPVDKHEIEARQRDLSRFFYGWDRGTLVKARIGNEWRICNRHPDSPPMAAAARPAPDARVIGMRIDPETLGLRFK